MTAASAERLAAVLLDGGATAVPWVEPADAARVLSGSGKHAALVRLKPFRGSRIRAELGAAGLEVGPVVVFAPSVGDARYLAVLSPAALGRLFELAEPALGRIARPAAALLRRDLVARALAQAAPNTAAVVRRPGSPPPLSWLAELMPGKAPRRDAVVVASRRGMLGGTVVHVLPDGETAFVAKIAAPGADGDEERGLVTAAESARRCGIDAPELLTAATVGDRRVVVETSLRGRPAAVAPHPRRRSAFADLCERLLRWNRETRVETEDGGAWLRSEVVGSASRFLESAPGGAELRGRLEVLAARLDGGPLPLSASHGDLTLWNVLVEDDGALGVVDWETARARDLPLGDFFYLTADAWIAFGEATTRAEALRACFFTGGAGVDRVASIGSRWRRELALPAGAAEAAFLATWIRHARVERERGGGSGEFLEALATLTSAATLAEWIRD